MESIPELLKSLKIRAQYIILHIDSRKKVATTHDAIRSTETIIYKNIEKDLSLDLSEQSVLKLGEIFTGLK